MSWLTYQLKHARAFLFAVIIIVGIGALLYSYFLTGRTVRREIKSYIESVEGVKVGKIQEISAVRLDLYDVEYSIDHQKIASAESLRLKLQTPELGGVPELKSVNITNLAVYDIKALIVNVLPQMVAANAGVSVNAIGDWYCPDENKQLKKYNFSLRFNEGEPGKYNFSLNLPDPGIHLNGEYDGKSGDMRLQLNGKISGEILKNAGIRTPIHMDLPGYLTYDGIVKINLRTFEFTAPLVLDGTFLHQASINGDFFQIMPGGKFHFNWRGPNKKWTIKFPDAEVVKPYAITLGSLTVSGNGSDPDLDFVIESIPPVGELIGRIRLNGKFNRDTGEWEFFQSESSNKTNKWNYKNQFAIVDSIWKSPRISGSGKRGQGEVNYSFIFDEFNLFVGEDSVPFKADNGDISGVCKFNFEDNGETRIEVAGEINTSKLEWPDPQCLWNSTKCQIRYSLHRDLEDKNWLLDLEPFLATVNMVGGSLPKIRLENISGKLSTQLRADNFGRWPDSIGGLIVASRANLVNSPLGVGSFSDIKLAAQADLAESGKVKELDFSLSAGPGNLKFGDFVLQTERVEGDGKLDREQLAGDNFSAVFDVSEPRSKFWGFDFANSDASCKVTSSLRKQDITPENFLIEWSFPMGSFKSSALSGSFGQAGVHLAVKNNLIDTVEGAVEFIEFTQLDYKKQLLKWTMALDRFNFKFANQGHEQTGQCELLNGNLQVTNNDQKLFNLKGMELKIPLRFPDFTKSEIGTWKIEKIDSNIDLFDSAGGNIYLRDRLFFTGQVHSGYFQPQQFKLTGDLNYQNEHFVLSNRLDMPKTKMNQPFALSMLNDLGQEVMVNGIVGVNINNMVDHENIQWDCRLGLENADISGKNFGIENASGDLVFADPGNVNVKSEARLKFGKFNYRDTHGINGELLARYPHFDECDLISLSGTIWQGKVSLANPINFRKGVNQYDLALNLNNIVLDDFLRSLGLPQALVSGRASGKIEYNGNLKLELGGSNISTIQLEKIEQYVDLSGSSMSKMRPILTSLRSFNCRKLSVNIVEADENNYRLTINAFGRPTGSLIPEDKAEKFRRIGAEDLVISEDFEINCNYLIPKIKR